MSGAPTRAIVRRPANGSAPAEASEAADAAGWWLFEEPVESLVAQEIGEVAPLLAHLEAAGERGLWAVGYVTYEAAPAFDRVFTVCPKAPGPLAAFSLFAAPRAIPSISAGTLEPGTVETEPAVALLGEAAHAAAIARILGAIAAGETYQVNFTFPLQRPFAGDPEALFWRLAPGSAAPHACFLDCGERAILSLSPELFFAREAGRLVMRPMKGTRPRGRFTAEDEELRAELATSPKERAENLMIVDMVRNDLGRLAEPGSVATLRLFEIERYPTVWQMTSTVTARSSASL
ncbi:MAG: chorismate-binding protein, partial [Thermoanaerobaculia bacterium]